MEIDGKRIVQRFWEEVFSRGNLAEAERLLTPDWRLHQSEYTGGDQDLNNLRATIDAFRDRYPVLLAQVTEQAAVEGDRVLTRFVVTATSQEPQRQVTVEGMSLSRFSGEQIRETWITWDAFGLVCQEDGSDWPKCWWCR